MLITISGKIIMRETEDSEDQTDRHDNKTKLTFDLKVTKRLTKHL